MSYYFPYCNFFLFFFLQVISPNELFACVGSLLSHAESLIPGFLNEEDVQLLR